MTKLVAMPSPSGRNAERLYLPERLAADSATSTSASAKALSQLQLFLAAKLTSPEDQAMAENLVNALLEAITPDDDSDANADPDDDDQAAADKRRRGVAGDRALKLRRDAAKPTFDAYRRPSGLAKRFADVPAPAKIGHR
jgi:hypothetical protein